jgi:hypothetical protein
MFIVTVSPFEKTLLEHDIDCVYTCSPVLRKLLTGNRTMPDALSPEQKAARLASLEKHLDAENNHDVDGIMKTYGQNPVVVINSYTFEHPQGIRSFHEKFGFGQCGSFTNLRVQERQRYTCDDAIILEATLSGKHTATWQGIAATGRDFEIPVCTIYTFDEEGKLAGEHVYFDSSMLISQLRS